MLFLNNSDVFLSAALNDRVLNVWSTESNSTAAALYSFTINDGPVYLDAACQVNEENKSSAIICAVTAKGDLFIYNHLMQEKSEVKTKLKKPIKAAHQLQMQTNEGAPLQIFAAFVTNEFNERLDSYDSKAELTLYLVYGSHVNPIIEKMVPL